MIVYEDQKGNSSKAARILNLHRQSLLYRLKKIESLTNMSLNNQDDVLLLNLSIKVWHSGLFAKD
ncbi:helix-turn-helix domain-containing protein [Virgibacillus sp. W0430]|uniref:helix-turn-helix domain-containing protein n=1 Tax=Virgibacillus sp. W0430 TaxID=3391580 RepID=UPI003F464AD0